MSKPKLDDVITKYADTGDCEIDCDVVEKLWGKLWLLSQWKEEFRLVKFCRKDSPNTGIKITISNAQANELISRLSLVSTQGAFPSGQTWRLADHS